MTAREIGTLARFATQSGRLKDEVVSGREIRMYSHQRFQFHLIFS